MRGTFRPNLFVRFMGLLYIVIYGLFVLRHLIGFELPLVSQHLTVHTMILISLIVFVFVYFAVPELRLELRRRSGFGSRESEEESENQ